MLLADSFPITLHRGGAYSITFLVALACIIAVQGPAAASVAAAFVLFSRGYDRTKPNRLARRLFNTSQYVIASAIGGVAYHAVAKLFGPVSLQPQLRGSFHAAAVLVASALAASITFFLMNTALVSIILASLTGARAIRVWMDEFANLVGSTFAFAVLGILLGALTVAVGWAAVLFLLVPFLVARNAFQASVRWASSYEATVRSLITAIEKKDAYTRGHAERVAMLAEMTANEMRLSPDRQRLIRFAALMHDVGKLGVSTKILQKAGKLTPDEYEHMKQHPLRGHEIVGEIDFLAEAVGAVRHHHEKVDGTGYPDGLTGEQIPLLARIITVADAFDSMTSTRVYRQAKDVAAAFAELHRCSGSQFDERCLAALESAVRRHGWQAHPETYPTAQEVLDARAAAL
jgi:HD-GYP domain-containing protein (c-di-GMP phosphodiesterase class II)